LLHCFAVGRFLRQNWRFLCALTLIGLGLRLACAWLTPTLTSDTWYYGELAKNWLLHGVLGVSIDDRLVPSYVRLPGYPAFLAAIFAVFGVEHYRAVMVIQALFDVCTCFIVADLARRVAGPRAARYGFLLAALCPFLINYVATGLTETLAVFFTAVALDLAVVAMDSVPSQSLRRWAACGLAIACGILLRPDGGIVLAALLLFLTTRFVRRPTERRDLVAAAAITTMVALAPLAPWTIRNWRDFHRFQPLAPRYANAADEYAAVGFERWVRTWMADYVSVQDFYWHVNGEELDVSVLPQRAFDSPEQRERTKELIDQYNETLTISPEFDEKFATLAAERIRYSPLRYYLQLPIVRIADMWLRPRTEMMAIDERWWDFHRNQDIAGLAASCLYAALNFGYIAAAFGGFVSRRIRYAGLLLGFVLLRTAFLGTLENPESRYTLECYPVVIVGASAALACWTQERRKPKLAVDNASVS
jgi:4-amino-4-deoxy-L-arabinose transferase-like glycosyltransferase